MLSTNDRERAETSHDCAADFDRGFLLGAREETAKDGDAIGGDEGIGRSDELSQELGAFLFAAPEGGERVSID